MPEREWLKRYGRRIQDFFDAEADQLPLWLPVGLGTGIGLWFVLPSSSAWQAAILGMLALAMLGLAVGERGGRFLAMIGLTAALGMSLSWFRADQVASPRLQRPVVAVMTGRIIAIEQLASRQTTRLVIANETSGLPPRLRVTLARNLEPAVRVGDRIRLRTRLMPPAPPVIPGAYDFSRIAWFRGLGATGRALGAPEIISHRESASIIQWIDNLRARLTVRIKTRVGGEEGGIAATLVTGDQGAVDADVAEALRISGLAHLLSISGLHVAAVVGAAILLLQRSLALSMTLAIRWPLPLIGAAGGALAGIAYTLLAGSNVPTLRACLAAVLVLIGFSIGRDALSLRVLAAAAFFILLVWPETFVGPSFQLSFAAVTAIIALYETDWVKRHLSRREEGLSARFGRAVAALLLTGLAVEIALAPIALFHFNRFGLYGALANIVAIPLTTFVIMPLEALALLLDPIGLAGPVYTGLKAAIALLIGLARMVADLPGATARLPTMPNMAFAAIVGGALWLLLWRRRARLLGLIPIAAGALIAALHDPPDLLISGDGRHVAMVGANGSVALVRGKAGDFMRETMGEVAGTEVVEAIDAKSGARCGPDACSLMVGRSAERIRLLATRSADLIDRNTLEPACANADIVVSDRRLPYWCRPRWLKADRTLLSHTGGLTIDVESRTIRSVKEMQGDHPWAIGMSSAPRVQ